MTHIVIPFEPRQHQVEVFNKLRRFNVLVCHRRFGKTVLAINYLIKICLTCDKPNPRCAYLAPLYRQAKSVAWTMLKEYTRMIPGVVFNEAELRADFPNGGRIQLFGADNYDSLRGIYLDAVVLDEVAQMSRAAWTQVIRPALSDRKGTAIFIGTPQSKNMFYDLYEDATFRPNWFRAMYKASDTGIIDPEELEAMKEEMEDYEYEQELECSWTAAIRGAYYAKQLNEIESHITEVPYDQNLPVITACDLGISDGFSIWYIQVNGAEIRVIDYDEYTGMGLPDVIKEMDKKPYKYSQHIAPFDIEVRELGTGKSRLEVARTLGINYTIAPKLSIQDGINAVRTAIPRMWFDKEKCRYGLEAIIQYKTEFNETKGTFSNAPLHDWTSHAADALRYFCVTKVKTSMANKPLDYSKMDKALGFRR